MGEKLRLEGSWGREKDKNNRNRGRWVGMEGVRTEWRIR